MLEPHLAPVNTITSAQVTVAQLLIIDDHDSMREGLELLLRKRGHRTVSAENGQRGLELLEELGADLVITDLKMAQFDGIEVLRRIKERHVDTDVLVMTGYGTIENAVEAMKLGAVDFITKPFSSEEFGVKVDRLLADRLERGAEEPTPNRSPTTGERPHFGQQFGDIVGSSEVMQDVFRWVDRVARSESSVIVYGESGTGKELVAQAIHQHSSRKDGPFVRVNCGALSESLLDSELFGHERGAFTGADRQRRGRFELAHGGTLFLDEIATISLSTQIRLLRVLQERELERVGGEETVPVDVRIIAATNSSAEDLLNEHGFREDLFYRLHVVPLTLPPLRARRSDVAVLAEHFVAKLRERTRTPVRRLAPSAIEQLTRHSWPGNVRELENVIERALVLADGEVLAASDLPPFGLPNDQVMPEGPQLPRTGMDLAQELERIEERLIREALELANGVKAEAARLLRLKPSALHYKLAKYGLVNQDNDA